jgi:alpha-galactosidase
MGWQFDRPDLGEGTVEAFRRPDSIYEAARLKLHGLDPGKRYRVTNRDTGQSEEISGSDLAAVGLLITLPQQPDSAVLVYKRL